MLINTNFFNSSNEKLKIFLYGLEERAYVALQKNVGQNVAKCHLGHFNK